MNRFHTIFIFLIFSSVIFPRNIVQEWLSENKKFINSKYKKIQFDIETVNELKQTNVKNSCNYIESDSGKFVIELEQKKLISNGEFWINVDERTQQAVIQYPDSTFIKNMRLASDFKKLQKLMSMSILKNNVATFYNDGTEIKFKFKDKKLNEVKTSVSGNSIIFNNINFIIINEPSEKLFQFENKDFTLIDLRE